MYVCTSTLPPAGSQPPRQDEFILNNKQIDCVICAPCGGPAVAVVIGAVAVVSKAVAVVSGAVADFGEVIGAVAVLCAVPG
jgi:hypothetical protein